MKLIAHKKVLLRERKRHTAHRTSIQFLCGGEGSTLILAGDPNPDWGYPYSAVGPIQKATPILGRGEGRGIPAWSGGTPKSWPPKMFVQPQNNEIFCKSGTFVQDCDSGIEISVYIALNCKIYVKLKKVNNKFFILKAAFV